MNRHSLLALTLLVLVLSAGVVSPLHASVLPVPSRLHPSFAFAKSGTVHFSIRNQSSAPVELRAGDTTMTVDPGKTISMDLPVGAKVVTAAATGTRPAGDLIAEVSSNLKGSTIVLR